MSSITERVQAGMDWLDEHYPDHVERFDPDNFDIMCRVTRGASRDDTRQCVLSQAAGQSWHGAFRRTGMSIYQVAELGFFPRSIMSGLLPGYEVEVATLNQAWLAAYEQRRAALV